MCLCAGTLSLDNPFCGPLQVPFLLGCCACFSFLLTVTLAMLRLPSDEAVAAAARVIAEAGSLMSALVPLSTLIRFEGVKAFDEGKVACMVVGVCSRAS